MVTKNGVAKKVDAGSFFDVRRSGIISIKLKDDDRLVSASFIEDKDEAVLVTHEGQSIRFKSSDIREMGRGASGVKAMKLGKEDFVVAGKTVKNDKIKKDLLVFSENGYGKQTSLDEYKVQKRGGSGIKTAKVTAKNGKIISAAVVSEGEVSEVVAMSQKGQVIRLKISEIPELGRQTQGVRVMKLRAGDQIASLVCL
jgi:DNA gyrase subunit A